MARLFAFLVALMASDVVLAQVKPVSDMSALPSCAFECLDKLDLRSRCLGPDIPAGCRQPPLPKELIRCVTGRCSTMQALSALNLTSTDYHATLRDRSAIYVKTSVSLAVITGVAVAQRFAVKLRFRVDLGLDDWSILITTICGIPNNVLNVNGMAAYGLGKDSWTLSARQLVNYHRYFYVSSILYLALQFLSVFLFAMYWEKWYEHPSDLCRDMNAIGWAHAAISIALDCWIWAVPLSQLKHLNLSTRKKVAVGIMFGLGAFVTIVSILRLQSLVNFGTKSINDTWENFNVAIWSTVEINVGIICACMPSLWTLCVRLFPRIIGQSMPGYMEGSRTPVRSERRVSLTSKRDDTELGILRVLEASESTGTVPDHIEHGEGIIAHPEVTEPVMLTREF
ncbi:hypothetical protein NM208_g6527 [Fusarium decemcellulare]|uniref:Uncharacterized protein n=1 Tax=Fusarium decemcellulare TaxID=57161 RepID=A0ACC1SCL0_9HYPO|nr:hypothetical protein NM208_g6527 [Fusarium decemcellulare]